MFITYGDLKIIFNFNVHLDEFTKRIFPKVVAK